jgi:hypothetical protein
MNIKPSTAEAQRRLRVDDDSDLLLDMNSAIDEAHAEMLAFLDRAAVYVDAAAMAAVVDPLQAAYDAAVLTEDASAIAAALADLEKACTGMVIVQDLLTAQVLLAGVRVADHTPAEREQAQTAAENIMRRHRRFGV